jgi:hypothetical protein
MESQTYFGPLYARLADAKPVSFRTVETSNWKPIRYWRVRPRARLRQAGDCSDFLSHFLLPLRPTLPHAVADPFPGCG